MPKRCRQIDKWNRIENSKMHIYTFDYKVMMKSSGGKDVVSIVLNQLVFIWKNGNTYLTMFKNQFVSRL